ncbi:unnamed protein product [Thlaspi arvense]|uniref:PLAT domain-containing protein n=1 Tax=Thlaspi arvense TaxID=13288 RepID=A0AAU9SF67_THLAR|nr:unnamed protein product [Thlaspi arvense]
MARPNVLFLSLLFIATVSVVAFAEDCVYTLNVKTGTISEAGTDAKVSIIIADKDGNKVQIQNLENWGGLMGPGHDYFENGNLDVFASKATCLASPICLLNVTSDGTGFMPGWYLDYVDVTTVRPGSTCTHRFNVDQWLATDEPPYSLNVIRNRCAGKVSSNVGQVVGSEIRKSLS